LKNCLMPSAVTKNNTLVFPYFNWILINKKGSSTQWNYQLAK
jgi:hypothetical protein